MTLSRQDIEFRVCDGTTLRGWHYPRESQSPCIIMSHGLAGIRHFLLPPFAERFHQAGFAVLVYDNRNWGDSDGEPRQESNPALQQTDYYDAFNFAVTLPGVDPERIVYWGTSFSGGNVIYAAAVDKRIKAAIVQAPAVSGETRSLAFKDRIPALFQDRANIVAGKTRGRVPCVASDLEAAKTGTAPVLFPDLHAYQALNGIYESGGRWENWVTEQTQLHMLEFEAQAMIHRVTPTPLLMVVPGNDRTVRTSSQLEAFGKAREPKQLYVIDGVGHFDIYVGEAFEKNIAVQIEFLRKHV
ncbi:alpha/beta superfamily hydrolase [Talaromyces proteolyticus]|uniref:Alpha/beta superfamily hydrolase n=1 Tax=Talaromyces proteolyticus TaxID=1131652 RepID=A0AAD4KPK2_9EURO|nr:alpha/beta superfamily hydrolase [Talaromyces proteolyticus]KAH8695378.1 alpha/beta superfamily hydrolase [Talaromyces proteolyticus]